MREGHVVIERDRAPKHATVWRDLASVNRDRRATYGGPTTVLAVVQAGKADTCLIQKSAEWTVCVSAHDLDFLSAAGRMAGPCSLRMTSAKASRSRYSTNGINRSFGAKRSAIRKSAATGGNLG